MNEAQFAKKSIREFRIPALCGACTVLFIFLTALPARTATPQGPGIGIMIGEPTGLTFRYRSFPVIGLAWSIENHFHAHCDYWVYTAPLAATLDWYAGAGAKFIAWEDNDGRRARHEPSSELGVRIPVGLSFMALPKLELFAEIAPGISLLPSTAFDLDAGIGARWYF
ncbi:MAG: hypothetical protein EPN93_07920 [Spirochaetes bacterium]|nr:MAG: hypothetical protein EPN93_07920 [Spirochaetota bacterium]